MAPVNTLNDVNRVINMTTFGFAIVLQMIFFVRFKFKADKAAMGILLIYLAVNAFRIIITKTLFGIIDIIVTPTTTTIIFSLLYFFVFEMSYSKAILTA